MTVSDKSDYDNPRINLFDRLPEVLQSDTNKALFENLFNRYLTKQDTEKVVGYIGEGNRNAPTRRQVSERDVHRQAYQLQPVMYNKIGSVEWITSWYDILNKAERLGVSREDMQSWLDLVQFNWAPPIDLDKLIHYQDYFWYDEDDATSQPQYITIRSRCAVATAIAAFQQSIVDQFGATFPAIEARTVDAAIPTFDIISLNGSPATIVVEGDIRDDLADQQFFNIADINNDVDGVYQVGGTITYVELTNRSTIPLAIGSPTIVDASGSSPESVIGTLTPRRFDKLVVDGDLSSLFDPNFIFFYKMSTNAELNNSFLQVSEVQYDELEDETIVTLTTVFTDNVVDGVISQEEKLEAAYAERDCQCSNSIGWDVLQWDDNPDDPLWSGDHSTFISAISNVGAPVAAGGDGQLWYDTSGDKLYQYSEFDADWKLLWNNFSLILEDTTGRAFWDFTPDCGDSAQVPSAQQWIDQNKWLHRSDVPDFSKAKRASLPIIEYDWDLELNEWTYVDHTWKYRSTGGQPFNQTTEQPPLIELIPLSKWSQDGNEIVLAEEYGDLTSYFTPGRVFASVGLPENYTVAYSYYAGDGNGQPYKTRIRLTVSLASTLLVPSTVAGSPVPELQDTVTPLIPEVTLQGDPWANYGIHWVYVGASNPVPVNHQPENPLAVIPTLKGTTGSPITGIPSGSFPTTDASGEYEFTHTYYAQEVNILLDIGVTRIDLTSTVLPGTTISLRERAILGGDDIRVYVNDIRQVGTYTELDSDGDGFVTGITFLPSFALDRFDIVRIEVGEASPQDFGLLSVDVRTVEDDTLYASSGNEPVSLVRYRKQEQVKADTNQYPLFDMYRVDGTPAYQATPIFSFVTDSTAAVNSLIGQRLATDFDDTDFVFKQHLVDEDGTMYAYRDYSNRTSNYWYDPETEELWFWDGLTWANRAVSSNAYLSATVGNVIPQEPLSNIDGVYWYDTVNQQLVQLTVSGSPVGGIVLPVTTAAEDPTLQTIWKAGINKETYTPEKRDWFKRSLVEYNDERDTFIEQRATNLQIEESLTPAEATTQATTEWFDDQANPLSTDGQWVGDWEIPDPLYFNVSHENRIQVTSRELLTHFDTIIEAQEKIPGYQGNKDAMFHLIPFDEVNYGLGGTIKEYNYSFDIFLSSLLNNMINPLQLYEFAQDQYQILLNNLQEVFRRDAVEILTDTSVTAIADLSTYVAGQVITRHEQNDYYNLLYGDSTTFTDVEGTADTGIRNWIATLPYIELIRAVRPEALEDPLLGVNEVVHHDTHRDNYAYTSAVVNGIVQELIETPDQRTASSANDDPDDTFGRISTSLPPNNTTEFASEFETTILNRTGVYWYHSTSQTLYRLNLIDIGDNQPDNTYEDGELWLDLTGGSEILRNKVTDPATGEVTWEPVDGLGVGGSPIRLHNGTNASDVTTSTVSAWQEVVLDNVLRDTVLAVEEKLFENAPEPLELRYDFDTLPVNFPADYERLLEQRFSAYLSERELTGPYQNVDYESTDPFTWNYKYSTPGQKYDIVDIDEDTNSFIINGNLAFGFPANQVFYIKNSGDNDGLWKTSIAAEAIGSPNYQTRIYVDAADRLVTESTPFGELYRAILPSPQDPDTYPFNLNDGSECGADWRDLYQKLYRTPYPHLEPWRLQGYDGKPTWWDAEYKNTDPDKWGDRRWNYKHGFDLVSLNSNSNTFSISGDFCEVFYSNVRFNIDRSDTTPSNNGVWEVDTLDSIISVATGTAGTASILIPGNRTTTFAFGKRIGITDAANQLTDRLTISSSSFDGVNTTIEVEEEITTSTGYDFISGSIYDLDTNRTTIYINTSAVGARTNVLGDGSPSTGSPIAGRIALAFGMWENIRQGHIPAGRDYPSGVTSVTGVPSTDMGVYNVSVNPLPRWRYFSINIDNDPLTSSGFLSGSTYNSDELLPPYWDYVTFFGAGVIPAFDRPIRSVYFLYSQIVSPGADYTFGDGGPIEWEWRNSSQFLYDQMSIAFKLDPVEFVFKSFGPEFYEIGCLQIDKNTEQVLSHGNTTFHGDLVNGIPVQHNGTNQWYINYARYAGYDISLSDFRSAWTDWTAPLTYQFASFVDTPSFELGHRQVCLSDFDYKITSKRSPGVEDYWLESFEVSFLTIPPNVARQDNEDKWLLEVDTRSRSGLPVSYYDVRNYQFYADPDTDECTIYRWAVLDTDIVTDAFTIDGDQTSIFTAGREFDISNSTGNDGTYTVESSAYNSVTKRTTVETVEEVSSSVDDGLLTANYRSLPWETGDIVTLTSDGILPYPLQGDNVNGVYQYFVIVVNPTTFKLATTHSEAQNGTGVDITSTGSFNNYVGQISATFTTSKTPNSWRHYVVDTSTTLELTPPAQVQGIQNFVNIINGYRQYTEDQGWKINSDNSLRDFDSSDRYVSWQLELERMIDFAIGLRQTRNAINQQFEVTVDTATDVWTFEPNQDPQFITGDQVLVQPSGNVYPTPLQRGVRYYMIRDSIDNFRLAASQTDARNGEAIDITSIAGVQTLNIASARNLQAARPKTEVNPFRNAVWFNPTQGVVSDVLDGPIENTFDTQLLIDQYGRQLNKGYIRVLRQDKETAIRVQDAIFNDIGLSSVFPSPYNFLHLAAAHLFIDTYEHVLIFNNRTTESALIYDPFLGLNLTKFEVLFNRQPEYTGRPNIGGQFYSTDFNQGAALIRNIEASVEDIRTMYDTYNVIEANNLVATGRKSLGYDGRENYLDLMNINAKSQFAFWRGQIQNKGSVNSITAFINSRRFVDASVDEFWAYKIADFGSAQQREYISMLLSARDAISNILKLHFISELEGDTSVADTGFRGISLTDQNRWFDQPVQLEKLRDDGGTLYFNLKPTEMVPVTISDTAPGVGSPNTTLQDGEAWIDTSNAPEYTFYTWKNNNVVTDSPFDRGEFVFNGMWNTTASPSELPIMRHGLDVDYLRITMDWYPEGKVINATTVIGSPSTITMDPFIHSADSIRVFKDGVLLDNGIDYIENITDGELFSSSITLVSGLALSPGAVRVVYKTSTLVEGIHFDSITNKIVQLRYNELVTGGSPSVGPTNVTIWGWVYDKTSQNPAKIIDTEAEVVITNVEFWDPARGAHYSNGIHVVDLQRAGDPATYTNTLITDQAPDPIYDFELIYNSPWNKEEVGTVWLDTTNLVYRPYNDPMIISNVDERAKTWGQLADYGDVEVYTWVESDIPPDEYDIIAEAEEGDSSIDPTIRKTGTAKKTLYKRDINGDWIRAVNIVDSLDVSIDAKFDGTNATLSVQNIQPVSETITAIEFANGTDDYSITFSGHYGRRVVDDTETQINGSVYPIDGDIEADDTALTTTATMSGVVTTPSSASITTDDDVDANLDGTYFTLDIPTETFGETDDYYVWYNTPSRPEITDITAVADIGGSLDGTYFTLNAPGQDRYVWFTIDGFSPTADDPGLVGSPLASGVGVQIIISENDTATDIALDLQTALDSISDFSVSVLAPGTIRVTNVTDGSVVNASNGTSGFSISVDQQGTDATSDPAVADRTGVQVDIDTNATAAQVASATRAAMAANITNATISEVLASPANTIDVTATIPSRAFTATLGTIPLSPGFDLTITDGIAPAIGDAITFYEKANIYVNGNERETDVSIPVSGSVVVSNVRNVDNIAIVQLPVPTFETDEARQEFIDAEVEVGNLNEDYEYTVDPYFDSLGVQRNLYYFWVRNKSTRNGKLLPPSEAQEQIRLIPAPFMFFQNVQEGLNTTFGDEPVALPVRFTQAVVIGLRGVINDDNRYVIRWTRDFTLRDTLNTGSTSLEKKQLHEEWKLIRRQQPGVIDRELWDRVTECIVGYKLNDPTERVPSRERELYDTENGTSTRIGLGSGQAFCDGDLAVATILGDFANQDNEFNVDLATFFANNNFDTPEAAEVAMNTIYTTFESEIVNRMFFDVLLDGLSLQGKYEDIFKTSMVALVGVRPFQVGGLFDD